MPTHSELENDQDILGDDVIRGFLEQTKFGTPAPTTRAMSLVYDPLSTAFEQAYSGISTTENALIDANEELISQIDGLQKASPLQPNTGYRTIPLECLFQIDLQILFGAPNKIQFRLVDLPHDTLDIQRGSVNVHRF